MDRKLFTTRFRIDHLPTWPCPSCESGVLITTEDRIKRFETAASKRHGVTEDWEPGDYRGHHLAVLTCNNPKCKEDVIMVGEAGEEHVHDYDPPSGRFDESLIPDLRPLHFLPPLKLFRIHARTPERIERALLSAFSLIWCDPPSS